MQIIDLVPNTGWIVQSGPNVNTPASDASTGGAFVPTALPGGVLKTTNAATVPMSGALVTNKRAVPPPFGGCTFPYVGLDLLVYVSSNDLPLLARLEIDVKISDPGMSANGVKDAPIYNFGGQWNQSTGLWQIDPAWTNTAFHPPIEPDKWMPFSFRYFRDLVKRTYSVLSITINGASYTVPSNLQSIACPLDAWAQTAAIQLQTETLSPGGLNVLYSVNDGKNACRLTWSDQPSF